MKRCLHCDKLIEHRQAAAKYCTSQCRQDRNNAKQLAQQRALRLAGKARVGSAAVLRSSSADE